MAFSPDGLQVVTGTADGTVHLWEAESGRELRRFKPHTSMVNAVAFSPDGRQVVSGSLDKTVRVWDVQTGAELLRLQDEGWVTGVAYSPDGSRILSGSSDKSIRLWDASTGKECACADELDDVVAKRGGRVYLTKDARMQGRTLRRMYPRLSEWREIKMRVDPTDRFASDLAHRLELLR